MKVVILCGGKGQRMREFTERIPKPLVEICGMPMIWHIMEIYKRYGFNEFILLLGYKGDLIKEYFVDFKWKTNDFTLDSSTDAIEFLNQYEDNFKITFLDTGMETMTGSRIKMAQKVIGDEPFMLTYGDGLSNIDINKLLQFHQEMGTIATVTGINKKSQYGTLRVENNIAVSFEEKQSSQGIINGGFFVLQPEIFRYLSDDGECIFEQQPLTSLASERQLAVYIHDEFWTAADTYNDIVGLNNMCEEGNRLWEM